jgi:hypothetical protein
MSKLEPMANMREQSKQNWTGNGTVEHINAGSLQRIADSLERIEAPYKKLLDDAQRYQQWYRDECATNRKMARRIAALQGVITRMKKRKAI